MATMRYDTMSSPVAESLLLECIAVILSFMMTRWSVLLTSFIGGGSHPAGMGEGNNSGGGAGIAKNVVLPLERIYSLDFWPCHFSLRFVRGHHCLVYVATVASLQHLLVVFSLGFLHRLSPFVGCLFVQLFWVLAWQVGESVSFHVGH